MLTQIAPQYDVYTYGVNGARVVGTAPPLGLHAGAVGGQVPGSEFTVQGYSASNYLSRDHRSISAALVSSPRARVLRPFSSTSRVSCSI